MYFDLLNLKSKVCVYVEITQLEYIHLWFTGYKWWFLIVQAFSWSAYFLAPGEGGLPVVDYKKGLLYEMRGISWSGVHKGGGKSDIQVFLKRTFQNILNGQTVDHF